MPNATEPLRHEVRIEAPPEVVFPFLTDPARMTEWFGVAALLDPRPGGTFRVEANGRDVLLGEYVEVDPPQRVVFTWGFDNPERSLRAGASTVEITLERDGDGTLLTLLHHDLAEAALREAHATGWEHYLERLVAAGAGKPQGRDPWIVTT